MFTAYTTLQRVSYYFRHVPQKNWVGHYPSSLGSSCCPSADWPGGNIAHQSTWRPAALWWLLYLHVTTNKDLYARKLILEWWCATLALFNRVVPPPRGHSDILLEAIYLKGGRWGVNTKNELRDKLKIANTCKRMWSAILPTCQFTPMHLDKMEDRFHSNNSWGYFSVSVSCLHWSYMLPSQEQCVRVSSIKISLTLCLLCKLSKMDVIYRAIPCGRN